MTDTYHATAVEIGGYAVVFTGSSGSGKSDLALRLIDRGAVLVGDDSVHVVESGGTLLAKSDAVLARRLEVRGVGIFEMDGVPQSPIRLIVGLGADGERLPDSWPLQELAGWSIPYLRLNAFAASAPIKIELALKSIVDEGLQPVRLPVLP